MSTITTEQVLAALSRVHDPEIGKPITDLDMVGNITISGSTVTATIFLTIAGCPLKDTISSGCEAAIKDIPGVTACTINMQAMSDEQRKALKAKLRGGMPEAVNPFADPKCRPRVYAVASGKGGVGKSSMTVNLAAALAAQGLSVGILDADIYGHSIPAMLGGTTELNLVDDMILPQVTHGIKHISIGHFVADNSPIIWRGPMLHRALTQFCTDVFWGDLDILLLDLPPGTGDIALSIAQLFPHAQLLIVTTPQQAAAEVAERAGAIAQQTNQDIAGVIENMGPMQLPDGSTFAVFGEGGGETVAARLTEVLGQPVKLLGTIPLDPMLRTGGDAGLPVVLADPTAPAAVAVGEIAQQLKVRGESLAGKSLGLSVN